MRRFFIILLSLILIFSPLLILASQNEIQISVEGRVSGTSSAATTTPTPTPSPGGGGFYIPPETKVVFKGRAYPLAYLTILKNEAAVATFQVGDSGLFERELAGLAGGNYTFGILAEDIQGRKSVTLSFTVDVISGMTNIVSGIFLPPTIEVSPVQVQKGQKINILGQSFPASQINIFISSKETAKEALADQNGNWAYKLDTVSLEAAEYKTKAQAIYQNGEQSPFSQTLSFLVVPIKRCKGPDLNLDNRVDLVDFSILLYFWGQKSPSNPCADINGDGIVNIIDFSIMMYWWSE
jgi:hypothetical protein